MDNNSDSLESFLETDEDAAGWMVTFADLMTLLLVFFVLLYSISSFNLQQFIAAFETMDIPIEGMKDPATGVNRFADIPDFIDSGVTIEELTGLRKQAAGRMIYEDFNQMVEESDLDELIDIQEIGGKIILMIQGNVLFPSASAELNKSIIPLLEEIADIVNAYSEYQLNIKGHTDNLSISTPQFPSNWELSACRATSVLKQMITAGISPERLTATGYGDIMPILPNSTEENRSLNRRVEFVLEKETK